MRRDERASGRVRRRAVVAAAVGSFALASGASGGVGQGERPALDAALGPDFELATARVLPRRALFDGPHPIRLRFRFRAAAPVDLRVSVVSPRRRRTVAAWTIRGAEPGTRYRRRWRGLDRRGRAVPDGRYQFRVGPLEGRSRPAGRFALSGHVHPVAGRHASRGAVGEFGAPRAGGRIHAGYDVLASCGTPLVAARGGKVKRSGYDDVLYGHWLLIGARKSREQYLYSHLIGPPRVARGERVRTGERVGRVGRTGNARTTPCHLHFELRRGGRAIDPAPHLRQWERRRRT